MLNVYDYLLKRKKILQMLKKGYKEREVAEEMGVSLRAIEMQVYNMRLKLCSKNKISLLFDAVWLGVIE